MAVIAGALVNRLVTQEIYPAVADVGPVGGVVLNQANRAGRAWPHFNTSVGTETDQILMRLPDSQVQKALRVEDRFGHSIEGLDDRFTSHLGRPGAVRMTTHPVDHDQNHGVRIGGNSDAVLIFFPTADQTQFCIFELQ